MRDELISRYRVVEFFIVKLYIGLFSFLPIRFVTAFFQVEQSPTGVYSYSTLTSQPRVLYFPE